MRQLLLGLGSLATSIGGVWGLTADWEDSTPLRGFGFRELGQFRPRPVRQSAVLASTEGGCSPLAVRAVLALLGLAAWGVRCPVSRRLF